MKRSYARPRRVQIINRDLQYTLLFASLLYVLLFFAVVGLRLFMPLFIELGKTSVTSAEVRQASSVLLYLHKTFWPAVLLSFLLIGLISIRTSHRIAGPLYRITRTLKSVRDGNLPKPIFTRKGDHLAPEVEVTNQMLEKLRIQVREIQETWADLNDALVACAKVLGHASTEEMIERMDDIRRKESQLADKIGYFKVE